MTNLTCCCCGDDAGKYQQWYNRDTGYGICPPCIDWLRNEGVTEESIFDLYGKEGINFGKLE